VGADRFHYTYAGAMLAINTFGCDVAMLLLVIALIPSLIPTAELDSLCDATSTITAANTATTSTTTSAPNPAAVGETNDRCCPNYIRGKSLTTQLQQQSPGDANRGDTKQEHSVPDPGNRLPPPTTVVGDRQEVSASDPGNKQLSTSAAIIVDALAVWSLYRLWVVVCACVCALIHRRHLMVWAIFAPKVVFEMAFWCVEGVISILLVLSQLSLFFRN
jgi:hypothetical protein